MHPQVTASPPQRRRRRTTLWALAALALCLSLPALQAPPKPPAPPAPPPPPPAVGHTPAETAFFKEVAALPTVAAQFKRVVAKLKELNPDLVESRVTLFTNREKTAVASLNLNGQPVTEIWPIRAFTSLDMLSLVKTEVTDLTQIQGLPLTRLMIDESPISDLKPIVGLRLTLLRCGHTQVTDLSPARGMPLTWLTCENTGVRDLSIVKGMPLLMLFCNDTQVTDLTALTGCATLQQIRCDLQPAFLPVLKTLPKLQSINSQTALEVLDPAEFARQQAAARAAFIQEVSALPPAQQLVRVKARLHEVNGSLGIADMLLTAAPDSAEIVSAAFKHGVYTELWPLRALPHLASLDLNNSSVRDLTSLQGLPLQSLNLSQTRIEDLTPLAGMPLKELNLAFTPVQNFAVLKNLPLTDLTCDYRPELAATLKAIPTLMTINGVAAAEVLTAPAGAVTAATPGPRLAQELAQLAPEEQVKQVFDHLKALNPEFNPQFARVDYDAKKTCVVGLRLSGQRIKLIWPLQALTHLEQLDLTNSTIRDLYQLRGLQLQKLTVSGTGIADLRPLAGMPLTELACQDTGVADLTPLKDMRLTKLILTQTPVADLTPLKGMPLTWLELHGTQVADLTPLQGLPLTGLTISATKVADLTPCSQMPLKMLAFNWSRVTDLTPIQNLRPAMLDLRGLRIADLAPVNTMQIRDLRCDPPLAKLPILKTFPYLAMINGNEFKPDVPRPAPPPRQKPPKPPTPPTPNGDPDVF